MQISNTLSPKEARGIALRQGLLAGTIAGCVALLSTACRIFGSLFYSFNFIYLLACIAFFFAGWRAAKKTNRVDIGTLAGFWAGIATVAFAVVVFFVIFYGTGEFRLASRATLESYISEVAVTAILALLFGPTLGTVGGFIGKVYIDNPASPAVPAPPANRAPSAQPAQPSAPAPMPRPADPADQIQQSPPPQTEDQA